MMLGSYQQKKRNCSLFRCIIFKICGVFCLHCQVLCFADHLKNEPVMIYIEFMSIGFPGTEPVTGVLVSPLNIVRLEISTFNLAMTEQAKMGNK